MTGICGWFSSSDPDVSGRRIARMAAALRRRGDPPPRVVSAPFGGVAAFVRRGEVADVHADPRRLSAIWGYCEFADKALADEARRAGAAQALLAGYAERGLRVLDALS